MNASSPALVLEMVGVSSMDLLAGDSSELTGPLMASSVAGAHSVEQHLWSRAESRISEERAITGKLTVSF